MGKATDALCRFAILPKFILLSREKNLIYITTVLGDGNTNEPPITVQTDEHSKYTIAQVAAAAFIGPAADAFCRFTISPKFILIWSEKITSTDGKLVIMCLLLACSLLQYQD